MAVFNIAIDLDEVPNNDSTGYARIPDGDYLALITSDEFKAVKDKGMGEGVKLEITWQLPEYSNRLVWQNINIMLPHSEAASVIGRKQLKEIADAVGYNGKLQDTSVLHGKPCTIRVGWEEGTNGFDGRNVVKRVRPRLANTLGVQQAQQFGQAAQQVKADPVAAAQAAAAQVAQPQVQQEVVEQEQPKPAASRPIGRPVGGTRTIDGTAKPVVSAASKPWPAA